MVCEIGLGDLVYGRRGTLFKPWYTFSKYNPNVERE